MTSVRCRLIDMTCRQTDMTDVRCRLIDMTCHQIDMTNLSCVLIYLIDITDVSCWQIYMTIGRGELWCLLIWQLVMIQFTFLTLFLIDLL